MQMTYSRSDKPARPLLRRDDAAAYIRDTYGMPCSPRWLAKLAVLGGGPLFRKAGRTPLYDIADLDAWALVRIGAPQETTGTDTASSKTAHCTASPHTTTGEGGQQ